MLNMTHEFGFVAGAITRLWQFDDGTIAVVVVAAAKPQSLVRICGGSEKTSGLFALA